MSENKKQKFLIHGGILAIAGIIVRIIGMFYRVPLVNIIGSEGNGIYSVAYNIYNIMLVLSSYGLPMAVSKLLSARFVTRQYKNVKKIFICALTVSVCTGGLAAIILYFGADFIESMYKGVPGLAIPLRVLAPTIFFVAVMGVMRGFYQAQGTMIPTAISQLIEQIVNAFVSVLAGYLLVKAYKTSENVAAYGAAGGTLGTCLGALAGLILLIILYFIYKPTFDKMLRKDHSSHIERTGQVYKLIIITMIPIILSQTLTHICSVFDDMMFSNIMAANETAAAIKSDLGTYSSCFVLLIGIPQGIASAMSSSMLPSIVASYTEDNMKAVREKLSKTIKTNLFIAMPCFVGLFVLGKPIIELLFSRYDSSKGAMMLKIGAIAVIFYALSTVTSSALQAVDRMSQPVKYAGISVIVHIILVYVLLKFSSLGIYGIVIGHTTFPIIIFILNYIELRRYIHYRQEIFKTFIVPFVCSVIMGILCMLTYKGIYAIVSSNVIALAAAMLVAVGVYFGLMFMLRKNRVY